MASLIRKINYPDALAYLDAVKGKRNDDLSIVEFMAKIAATLAVRERRKQVMQAASWSRINARRKELNGRIWTLRQSIKNLEDKEPTTFVNWPQRREMHKQELILLEAELSQLLNKISDRFNQ